MTAPDSTARAHRKAAAWCLAASLVLVAPTSPVYAAYRQPPADAAPSQGFAAAFSDISGVDGQAGAQPSEGTGVAASEGGVADSGDADDPGNEIGVGTASYYAASLAGHPTANGERFDPAALTAAHRTLPFGSRVRVTNRRTGQSVVVRINDRGPFHRNRLIDLSPQAARQIGIFNAGSGTVELALLNS